MYLYCIYYVLSGFIYPLIFTPNLQWSFHGPPYVDVDVDVDMERLIAEREIIDKGKMVRKMKE